MLLIEKSKLESSVASENDHGRFQRHRGVEVGAPPLTRTSAPPPSVFHPESNPSASLSLSGPVGGDGRRRRAGEPEGPGVPGVDTKAVLAAAHTDAFLPGACPAAGCRPRHSN